MARTALDDIDLEIINAKNFATLSTLRADGTIWSTPVWAHAADGHILINGAEGRQWLSNLRERGVVTISVTNAENPYQYVTVTGAVADEDAARGDADIDRLANKYIGSDYPWRQPGEKRVSFKIAPTNVYRNR